MIRIVFFMIAMFIGSPSLAYAKTVQMIKSPTGISAWLVENHTLPIVSISFAWRGGIEQDDDAKQGLSHIAAAMLTKGAGSDDENAFQKKLEDHAIHFDIQAQRDAVTGQIRSLKETLPLAKEMMKASLTAPRFDDDALKRLKAQNISTLKQYQADPDWLLSRLMMREMFAGHAYGNRTLGTEKTIQSITRSDLQQWHKRLSRDRLMISVTGDIAPQELGVFLDETFGGLPQAAENNAVLDADLKGKGQVFVLTHPSPQSSMLLVWHGINRHDKDWYAAQVMNYILGGGSFSSRLMHEVREKRGLTYGIHSALSNFDHAFTYIIQASFKNEKAGEVLELTKKEITRMRDTKVSAQELKAAKDYLMGSYALGLTSTMRVAAHYLSLQHKKLSAQDQQETEAGIKAVTPEDIQRVAQRIFHDDGMIAFFIGQPQGITATQIFDSVE